MASPKPLSVIRIPRTYHQEQMHQIRQEIRSQIQQSSNQGWRGNTGRGASVPQSSPSGKGMVTNRR